MSILILHIGQPKAGSSAIQKYIAKKKDKYRDRFGILMMPDLGRDVLGFYNGSVDALNRLDDLDFSPKTSITSFELLWSKVDDLVKLHALKKRLLEHFTKVNIIVYLRRQDEVFISGYYSRCLRGQSERFSELKFTHSASFDYRRRLGLWASVFGRGSLTVRRYGPGYLFADDLFQDFCRTAKIPYIHTVFTGANRSPSAKTIELIRLLSKEFEPSVQRKHAIKAIVDAEITGVKLGLSACERREIINLYEADNNYVAKRFLGKSKLFDHPIPNDGLEYPTLSSLEVVSMMRQVLRQSGKDEDLFAAEAKASIDVVNAAFIRQFRSV
ncbi:hypothetical protein [Sphingorhabdus sp. EL138]|uniref:hypothetical protein n=1 Tax=Sphingorhabdus sp. EL138 TaxID=2073156 RepID=UPI0025FD55EB|nr:hypothetical protein [Sphingorhabdus sp. EL138]